MKFIVTGCCGFIGSHLVDRLIQSGYEVIGIDDLSAGKMENISQHLSNEKFTFLKLDITDWQNLSRHFSYFDYAEGIFHVAAKARIQFSIANPYSTHDTNVTGTLNILEIMRMCRIENIVFSSSSSIYGLKNESPLTEDMEPDCLNMYSLSKLTSEKYLKVWSDLYGVQSIALRYFNVYGPREFIDGPYATVIGKFFKQILLNKQPLTIIGDGKQSRDFTYVDDVVDANVMAMSAMCGRLSKFNGSVINIGTGKSYSILDVADLILESLDYEKDYKVFVPPRPAESRKTLANFEKAEKLLRWKPKSLLVYKIYQQKDYYIKKFLLSKKI